MFEELTKIMLPFGSTKDDAGVAITVDLINARIAVLVTAVGVYFLQPRVARLISTTF